VSLQAMYEANGNWLPAEIERDRGPAPDDLADRAKLRTRLARAIDEYLTPTERTVVLTHLRTGGTQKQTAQALGRSLTWTCAVLRDAQAALGKAMR
jgi:hypothetical protein